MLRWAIGQFLETVRKFGLRAAVRDVIFIDRIAVPMTLDLENFVGSIPPAAVPERCLVLSREVLLGGDVSFYSPYRLKKALHYFDKGYQAIGIVQDGQIAGEFWFCDCGCAHPDLDRFGLALEEDEVYGWDMWVAPALRNQGIGQCLKFEGFRLLREMGVRRTYGWHYADNYSQAAIRKKMGFEELDPVLLTRVLWWSWGRPLEKGVGTTASLSQAPSKVS